MAGQPPSPSPPPEEKVTDSILPIAVPVQESAPPNEHTNSLKKTQAPSVPEDDGFTRLEWKQFCSFVVRTLFLFDCLVWRFEKFIILESDKIAVVLCLRKRCRLLLFL